MTSPRSKTFIIKSGTCSWGRCIFCGYGKIRGYEPRPESINRDLDNFFDTLDKDIEQVKLFGSGSFLDDKQFPRESRQYFASLCRANGIKDIVFESKPEYIDEESLKDFVGLDFSVAIGLEVADDKVLELIKKGITKEMFSKAADTIHRCDGKVRTYLIANPPFVDDIKGSLDESVRFALPYSDSMVIINLIPHVNSEMIDLYTKGEWKPLDKEQFEKITEDWKNDPRIETEFETFSFEPRVPERLRDTLKGADERNLTHPHYRIWQDYFVRFYKVPEVKDTILFLPCAFRKPYSQSRTHREILKRIKNLHFYPRLHQVMISNPGVIPREFEGKYPFKDYDWPEWEETDQIKKRYTEVITQRIEDYLGLHSYRKVLSYFKPDSESFIALKKACKNLGIPLVNLLDEKIYQSSRSKKNVLITPLALNSMVKNLKKEMSRS